MSAHVASHAASRLGSGCEAIASAQACASFAASRTLWMMGASLERPAGAKRAPLDKSLPRSDWGAPSRPLMLAMTGVKLVHVTRIANSGFESMPDIRAMVEAWQEDWTVTDTLNEAVEVAAAAGCADPHQRHRIRIVAGNALLIHIALLGAPQGLDGRIHFG